MTSDDLGRQAYQKLMLSEYKEAVHILNTAIMKYPDDCKLYINRCFCLIQLREFASAMKDADSLIAFFMDIPNGFFLRGEIFLLTEKYEQAEKDFTKVLEFDSEVDLEEVHEKLYESRMQQIVQKGYTADVVRKALRLAHSTEEAITILASGLVKNGEDQRESSFKLTEEEEKFFAKEFEKLEAGTWTEVTNNQKTKPTKKLKTVKEEYINPLTDPTNPGNYSSLWVVSRGHNLLENIPKSKENELEKLFSQYGCLRNVNVHEQKKCIFVNYTSPEGAAKAMRALQNFNFNNVIFEIEYSYTGSNIIRKH